MPSECIYTMQDRTPYTYLIGWSELNKWYYGRRTAKNCHPSDLWEKYFTSSEYVKQFRKDHGEPDIIQVRRVFNSIIACCEWENKVLCKLSVGFDNDRFLNKRPGDYKWNNHTATFNTDFITGKTYVKHAVTNIPYGWMNITDNRYISGEYVNIQTGNKYKPNIKKNRKISESLTGKERSVEHKKNISNSKKGTVLAKIIDSGTPVVISVDDFNNNRHTYTGITSGYIPCKDSTGNTYMVTADDPRYISRELIHVSTGTTNEKCKNTAAAICTKTGEKLGRISTTDPRWVTGEIMHTSKGITTKQKGIKSNTCAAKETLSGNTIGQVPLDDPRWVTGEIVSARSTRVMVDGIIYGNAIFAAKEIGMDVGELREFLNGKRKTRPRKLNSIDVKYVQ